MEAKCDGTPMKCWRILFNLLFFGSQEQCIWISLIRCYFGKARSTDAGILHLAPWRASNLFSQGRVHESQPLCRCLRGSSPLSLQLPWFPGIQLLNSVHNCTLKLFATSMWQEAYQNRSQFEGLSFPHGPLEINRYQALNKKQSFFSERTWGKQVWSFFVEVIPFFKPTENPESQKRD